MKATKIKRRAHLGTRLTTGIYRSPFGYLVRVTSGWSNPAPGVKRTRVIDELWELRGCRLEEAIEWRAAKLAAAVELGAVLRMENPLDFALGLIASVETPLPWYADALGLDAWPNVSEQEIRQAFRAASKEAHPDRGGTHAQMVELSQAYDAAMDALKDRAAS